MSNGQVRTSSQDNHEREVELRGRPAHQHFAGAESREKQDHPTANEQSRWEREENHREQGQEPGHLEKHGHNSATIGAMTHFGHAEIAELAHQLWTARGEAEGSAEEDWLEAAKELRSRNESLLRHA